MNDIYSAALEQKFNAIVSTMARDLGDDGHMIGLIANRRHELIERAEQAIVDWATRRQLSAGRMVPMTNLQHLLDEYCAIAAHI